MSTRREQANAIRVPSVEAAQRAHCAHPGMGEIARVPCDTLVNRDPANPHRFDGGRLVLRSGHGAMLAYARVRLGEPLRIKDLKRLRRLGSRAVGQPVRRSVLGIELSAEPLGQGLAGAADVAPAAPPIQPAPPIPERPTHLFCADGRLMEGSPLRACSLAGTHAGLHNGGRGRRYAILVALRRHRRARDRSRPMRNLGQRTRTVRTFRIHRRAHRARGWRIALHGNLMTR